MKYTILFASPRPTGNTAHILEPFQEELRTLGDECIKISLFGKEINPCIACRACQDVHDGYGCVYDDLLREIFNTIMASDCLVIACPIYSWSCPAPMKAVLDRLVYFMNKYYGTKKGSSLWSGKHVAILTTCGYKPEQGADLFAEATARYCKHSQLFYAGMFAARDPGYHATFVTDTKIAAAREFAHLLHDRLIKDSTLERTDIIKQTPITHFVAK